MSAQSLPILTLSVKAGGSIDAAVFVTPQGLQASANSPILGVSRNAGMLGDIVPVNVLGTTTITSGGPINAGDRLASDANGRAVAYTGDATVTKVIAGGAAGNHTLSGIAATDTLVSVVELVTAADPALSALRQAVIAGGAAGNHTVTGILITDTLVSVHEYVVAVDTGTSASGNKIASVADLTSECSITATNTINNTSGTDTTGSTLIVTYSRAAATVSKISGAAALTAEFSVTAANTINNTSGTDTTGSQLLVTYRHPPSYIGGIALEPASGAGHGIEMLLKTN